MPRGSGYSAEEGLPTGAEIVEHYLRPLAEPIVAETGWRYGLVIGGVSFELLVSGLVSIHVGRAIERFGGRPVRAASALMIASGLALLAIAPGIEVYLAACSSSASA